MAMSVETSRLRCLDTFFAVLALQLWLGFLHLINKILDKLMERILEKSINTMSLANNFHWIQKNKHSLGYDSALFSARVIIHSHGSKFNTHWGVHRGKPLFHPGPQPPTSLPCRQPLFLVSYVSFHRIFICLGENKNTYSDFFLSLYKWEHTVHTTLHLLFCFALFLTEESILDTKGYRQVSIISRDAEVKLYNVVDLL